MADTASLKPCTPSWAVCIATPAARPVAGSSNSDPDAVAAALPKALITPMA
ncbi:hypothetical protein [Kibdelosporangium aridum]|uniref:hypothetical protein n=1 Tax=Kibdelosporangium aridum TaxID=2030 RepID=UPI0013589155|nr:hypothetical protein [Kibdelosporangium aridum]